MEEERARKVLAKEAVCSQHMRTRKESLRRAKEFQLESKRIKEQGIAENLQRIKRVVVLTANRPE